MLIAKNSKAIDLLPGMCNRHGIIAGSTGSGKTVTLQVMAEGFSRLGVPVFMADVKGDLGGIEYPGTENERVLSRVQSMGLTDFSFEGNPVQYWDVRGENGNSIKATVDSMGATLISRLLNLSDAQTSTLFQIFKIAHKYKIEIKDLNDIDSLADEIMDNVDDYTQDFGRISSASLGSLKRNLIMLEEDGEDILFTKKGEAFDVTRFLTLMNGRGMINILKADELINSPKLYASFLLWLIQELFDVLPERGDSDKPLAVFFFDEAHTLFDDAPKVLVEKIERLIKLIRSKGVGIFFVTQNPADIPDGVLGQLGNRVQHSMRAFTPKDMKAVRTIAQTFRINPALNVEKAITELKIGEALVSFLDETGAPGVVQRALIVPPRSQMGVN